MTRETHLNPPGSRPRPRTGRNALAHIAETWKRAVVGRDVWVELGAGGSFGWYRMKAVDAAIVRGRVMVRVVPLDEALGHWDWRGGKGEGEETGEATGETSEQLPGIWVFKVMLLEDESGSETESDLERMRR